MSKKSRASNLTYSEKVLLVDLGIKYRHVIDNKQTDAVSARGKEDGWRQLAEEFLASSAVKREWQQLKHALDNMKQRAKKALTVDKVESQRTGGGTFVRQVTELDEKLIALLGYRASPLCNPYDADASYNNESVTGDFGGQVDDVLQSSSTLVVKSDPISSAALCMTDTAAAAAAAAVHSSPSSGAAASTSSTSAIPSGPSTSTIPSGMNPQLRQWSRSARRRRPQSTASASDEISSLAKLQAHYYKRKLEIKEHQHTLYVEEQQKRMKVLDLQELYYAAKLRKLGEE